MVVIYFTAATSVLVQNNNYYDDMTGVEGYKLIRFSRSAQVMNKEWLQ